MTLTVDPGELAAELKALRRGRALRSPAVLHRLGPVIRRLCNIDERDGLLTIRGKLTTTVEELLRHEQEPKLAVMAALALHPLADHRDLAARERFLAEQLNCHERTARRRVDEAFELLVLAAVERASGVAEGPADLWEVQAFRAVLRLDGLSPELTEERTIVVTKDGLDQIVCRLSLPKAEACRATSRDIIAEILYGGRISAVQQPSDEHFQFVVDLPRRYGKGQLHEYAIRFTLPLGQGMAPHYVFLPLVACRSFDMTVKFDMSHLPSVVWRLNGVAPRLVDARRPGSDLLQLDRLGELRLAFRHLRQGFAYGVKWMHASGGGSDLPHMA